MKNPLNTSTRLASKTLPSGRYADLKWCLELSKQDCELQQFVFKATKDAVQSCEYDGSDGIFIFIDGELCPKGIIDAIPAFVRLNILSIDDKMTSAERHILLKMVMELLIVNEDIQIITSMLKADEGDREFSVSQIVEQIKIWTQKQYAADVVVIKDPKLRPLAGKQFEEITTPMPDLVLNATRFYFSSVGSNARKVFENAEDK